MNLLILFLALFFACIVWLNQSAALSLLIILLPSYLLHATFFGIPTTLLELMILSFIAISLVKERHRLKKLFSIPRLWIIAIVLLLLAAAIGVVIAEDKQQALGIFKAYYLEPILLFFVIKNFCRTRHVLQAFGISAILVSFFAIVQFITGLGIPIPWDFERRVTSVFDYPNAVGLFLGPIVILGFVQLFQTQKKSKLFYFWLAVVVLSFVSIVLAKSEAAIAAVVATALLFFFTIKSTRSISLVVFSAILLFSLSIPMIRSKLFFQDLSGKVRLSQWTETVELLKDRPLFGAGLSGYPTALEPYHKDAQYEIFQYPHNIFLNIWVELGLVGLVAFFLIVYPIFKTSHIQDFATSLFFFIFLEIFLHGLVDVPYFKNDLAMMTWIFFALFIANYEDTHQKISSTAG